MSGDGEVRGPARPIDLTDDDVRELAGNRAGRVAAVARLRKLVPSGPAGRLQSTAEVPVPVSSAAMKVIAKTGELPSTLARRLRPSAPEATAPSEASDERLQRPTKKPPKAPQAT